MCRDGHAYTGGGERPETPRIKQVSETLKKAGFRAPVVSDIRAELWTKLWGNVAFNPISVLTGANMARMANDPGVRAAIRAAMLECQAVAERLGARFTGDVEGRIEEACHVGDHGHPHHHASLRRDDSCSWAGNVAHG